MLPSAVLLTYFVLQVREKLTLGSSFPFHREKVGFLPWILSFLWFLASIAAPFSPLGPRRCLNQVSAQGGAREGRWAQ